MVVGAVERVALRVDSLLRLKNTVPRKIATVTHRTPKLPQKAALHPALSSGAVTSIAFRSANISLRLEHRADDLDCPAARVPSRATHVYDTLSHGFEIAKLLTTRREARQARRQNAAELW